MLSMTAMLIMFSVAGQSYLAADIGIAQAATALVFFAFSANARPTILATSSSALAKSIFDFRLILLAPLSLAAFWLTSTLGNVGVYLTGVLILRRAVEWLVEIDLSEKERLGCKRFALINIVGQLFLLILATSWLLLKMPYSLLGLFLWAIIPLLLSARFFWQALKTIGTEVAGINKKMVPHFGSSFVIGASLYAFRILMIALVGKSMSGDFFAAFAIGGVLGSVFVNAFGPSIAFNEKANGIRRLPKVFGHLLWFTTVLGILIFGAAIYDTEVLSWTGKASYFWQAVGLAMVGGVIMVHAQLLRNRLLVHNEEHDLWGPDLLMNILVIAALPLVFYIFGVDAVASLSLLSAALAWAFYKSSERSEISATNTKSARSLTFQMCAAMLVLVPIFISFDSGLFRAKEIPETGNCSLMSLPVPISFLFTYVGILVVGCYRVARMSIGTIFFTFIAMLLTTLMSTESDKGLDSTKLILIVQSVLPMGALALGEMFKSDGLNSSIRIEKIFLVVLLVIVPLQLCSSWVQGGLVLSGYLYVFSIYQHLDYVPVIFVSAYLMTLFSLWQFDRYRKILLMLSPAMGAYVAASLSLTAMCFLLGGVLLFAVTRSRSGDKKLPLIASFAVVVSCVIYLYIESATISLTERFSESALNIINSWQYYASQIGENLKALLLGHELDIDRAKYTSAHNYYLDMIRNFGLISIIPLLTVYGYTARACYLSARKILSNSVLLGHLLALAFLLLIDNSTEVSLRQPYSGVFTFFIWGLFIARLDKLDHVAEKCR